MNYQPDGLNIGDTWYFTDGKLTHCIHMQNLYPGSTAGSIEDGALGHAISEDLINWKTLPAALRKGEYRSYDDCDLWTGSVIRYENTFYLYYTARCSQKPNINRIALAVSKDGFTWVKYKSNPIITPDPRWYHCETNPTWLACHSNLDFSIVDCHDLCVVRDSDSECFWGFFAARSPGNECAQTSVIALCRSYDLIHWEQFPPCFVPMKYNVVEVPDVFLLSGKWYMLCLTGNDYGQRNRTSDPELAGPVTIYAVADCPQGPYVEPDDNVLIGSISQQGYCTKSVERDGQRFIFYTQRETVNNATIKTLSLPKVVKTDNVRHLLPCYYSGIDQYLGKRLFNLNDARIIINNGQWGSIGMWSESGTKKMGYCETDWAIQVFANEGKNFLYQARLTVVDARSAGLAFDIMGDTIYEGANVVLLDADKQEVLFTQTRNFPRIEARRWKIERNQPYFVKVLAIDATIEIYIDDIMAIQLQKQRRHNGKFGLFVEQGAAEFEMADARQIENSKQGEK